MESLEFSQVLVDTRWICPGFGMESVEFFQFWDGIHGAFPRFPRFGVKSMEFSLGSSQGIRAGIFGIPNSAWIPSKSWEFGDFRDFYFGLGQQEGEGKKGNLGIINNQ